MYYMLHATIKNGYTVIERQHRSPPQMYIGSEHRKMNKIAYNKDDCHVCFDGIQYEDDQIVYCDGCDIAVHQSCYGVSVVPAGNWYCDPCTAKDMTTRQIPCCICLFKGGALKPTSTDDGKWAHVTCAFMLEEVSFDDEKKRRCVVGIDKIYTGRRKLVCTVCGGGPKDSACIQCDLKKCRKAMHPLCAFSAGLTDYAFSLCRSAEDQRISVFCQAHAKTLPPSTEVLGEGMPERISGKRSPGRPKKKRMMKPAKSKPVDATSQARGDRPVDSKVSEIPSVAVDSKIGEDSDATIAEEDPEEMERDDETISAEPRAERRKRSRAEFEGGGLVGSDLDSLVPMMERLCEKHQLHISTPAWPNSISSVTQELLRFLQLKVKYMDGETGLLIASPPVDAAWRTLMLQRDVYQAVCQRFARGSEHVTVRHNAASACPSRAVAVEWTKKLYKMEFGCEPPAWSGYA